MEQLEQIQHEIKSYQRQLDVQRIRIEQLESEIDELRQQINALTAKFAESKHKKYYKVPADKTPTVV